MRPVHHKPHPNFPHGEETTPNQSPAHGLVHHTIPSGLEYANEVDTVFPLVSIIFEYALAKIYKKICGFSGLRPMRPCVAGDISRAGSRIFPATPICACLMAG